MRLCCLNKFLDIEKLFHAFYGIAKFANKQKSIIGTLTRNLS